MIIIIVVIYQKRLVVLKKQSVNTNPNVCNNKETKPPPYGPISRQQSMLVKNGLELINEDFFRLSV